jgi:hypothetical protein
VAEVDGGAHGDAGREVAAELNGFEACEDVFCVLGTDGKDDIHGGESDEGELEAIGGIHGREEYAGGNGDFCEGGHASGRGLEGLHGGEVLPGRFPDGDDAARQMAGRGGADIAEVDGAGVWQGSGGHAWMVRL